MSLVAGGSVNGRVTVGQGSSNVGITMLEVGSGPPMFGVPSAALTAPLHEGDDAPVLIYAGKDIDGGVYTLLKQARLWAGRDVAGVVFTGMNTIDGDITSIVAGRDILARRVPDVLGSARPQTTASFTLYGPGEFVIEAGRNLGPFSTVDRNTIAANPTFNLGGGIFAIGDGANSTFRDISTKPYLPQQGANITLRYGVAGGIDYAAVMAKAPHTIEQLVDLIIAARARAAGITDPKVAVSLTPAEAADVFNAMSSVDINSKLTALAAKAGFPGLTFDLTPAQCVSLLQVQQTIKLDVDRDFLAFLKRVGLGYKDPSSPYYGKYAAAYEAIATLFPASKGYTDNSNGGSGAIPVLKHTGDLRMARTLVETQTGGDINLIGPGGNAYVGSNSADTLTPAQQGILTLQGGSVRTYTDGSVLIYQSRVFTEQGGDIEIFSANGDLNTGKGPKSSAAYPPLRLICDSDGYCRVSPAGLVTGAGIGALLSVPGQDPTKSNVVLTAPHGVIDAGAAGIRVAGNATFNALQILNAFNIQVNGVAVGLPTVTNPNIGALTTASNAAGAATQATAAPQSGANRQPSIIIVEVLGFGGGDNPEQTAPNNEKRSSLDAPTYDPRSKFQVIGNGELSDEQKGRLTPQERSGL